MMQILHGMRKKIVSFFIPRKKEEQEKSLHFQKNGGALLEELVTTFGARYKNPIRNISANELIRATQGRHLRIDMSNDFDFMSTGSWEERPILVRRCTGRILKETVRDIAVTSQMSHHKNVLKLIGCCTEFESPALIYEYSGTDLLSDLLHEPRNHRILSWKSRLRIANDIANAIAYLHTVFQTPLIYRGLDPGKIIVDNNDIAKLFDFSLCISLPPGELHVEVEGQVGRLNSLDTTPYSRFITQKTDVYSFGVLMLMLLTGQRAMWRDQEGKLINIVVFVNKQLNQIVDPHVLSEGGGNEQNWQYRAFLDLALCCIKPEKDDRPEMIEVAKELKRISKCIHTEEVFQDVNHILNSPNSYVYYAVFIGILLIGLVIIRSLRVSRVELSVKQLPPVQGEVLKIINNYEL
ncbi:unnamed protein product [Fraxinus pennsylvanica]|uniref:Protein kinase domain-containing protein n=1 Tax=Fraxinus pennsylvanica TaxID=56036 RepID=A0AAD1ZG36_9LAMI|nr:unnamed protein product [Fraxinus pennsylvanica]